MTISKPVKDRRINTRFELRGDLSCWLESEAGGSIESYAVDVSMHGLGIMVIGEALEAGDLVRLSVGERRVDLRVVHCRPSAALIGAYHCGLEAEDRAEDLRMLFARLTRQVMAGRMLERRAAVA